jgi:tetratricopeptide (TPR) repeat protein
MNHAARSQPSRESKPLRPRKPFERVLRWVGSITAILSLFFGIYQLTTIISDARGRARHIEELYAIGQAQQGAGDYASAWGNFEQAAQNADEGGAIAKIAGHLDSAQLKVRTAQENLAMEWLRHIHAGSDEKFSATVDRVLPALMRGAPAASGSRKADLLAHIGWAYFLKSRDGMFETDPAKSYAQALAVDPGNPYAHANWGHWILWKHGVLNDAMKHFSDAIAANRELPYVRRLELAALTGAHSDATQAEFLRVVIAMHKNHEPIDERTRSDLYSLYYFAVGHDEDFNRIIAAAPAADQIDLIRAVLDDASLDPSKIPVRDSAIRRLSK